MDVEITGQPRKEWINTAEYKSISIASTRVEDRTVDGIAAVCGNVDDVGDITHKGAFTKTIQEGLRRVKFLWNHDFNQPPTARIDDLREISRDDLPAEIKAKYPESTGGLFVRRTYLGTPRGDECLAGVRDGAITEMSYGYNPVQKDYTQREGKSIRNLRQVRLLDVSDVMWGANAATVAKKGALPFHGGPLADKDTAWDGPAEVAKADVEQLKDMCAWVDPDHEDTKQGYKFPYKTADGKLVFKAAVAGMARLKQADIPEADRKAVYNILAKVYEKFGETPPDYKLFEIAYSVQIARNLVANGVNFKVGRTISAVNEEKIKSVIDAIEKQLESLEDLLGVAESPDEEDAEEEPAMKALTDPAYLLALLELDVKVYSE